MEFFNIINSFLSTFERKIYKLAKIQPIFDNVIYLNVTFDIETGLYYGEEGIHQCRITIQYPLNELYEDGFL